MTMVEFRDGWREVPEHLVRLMATIPTHQLTYDQAIDRMNHDLLSDRLDKIQSKVVSDHLARYGAE